MAQQKLISNQAVLYDAQSILSSVLTIVVRNVNIENIHGALGYQNKGLPSGSVIINTSIYANYGESNQTPVNGYNTNIPETTWDNFSNSQSLTTTELFNQVMETALLYTKENIPVMYGLSGSNWTYVNN
jgi:hypothetical protein